MWVFIYIMATNYLSFLLYTIYIFFPRKKPTMFSFFLGKFAHFTAWDQDRTFLFSDSPFNILVSSPCIITSVHLYRKQDMTDCRQASFQGESATHLINVRNLTKGSENLAHINKTLGWQFPLSWIIVPS